MQLSPDDYEDAHAEVSQIKRMMYEVLAKQRVKYPLVILACYDLIGTILIMAIKENRNEYLALMETLFEQGGLHSGFEKVIKQKIEELGRND